MRTAVIQNLKRSVALWVISTTFASLYALAESPRRQKVIDFDDEVVEGLNKRPLDSLSHISDAERRRRQSHLYRKRSGFSTEITETLQTLRYTP